MITAMAPLLGRATAGPIQRKSLPIMSAFEWVLGQAWER